MLFLLDLVVTVLMVLVVIGLGLFWLFLNTPLFDGRTDGKQKPNKQKRDEDLSKSPIDWGFVFLISLFVLGSIGYLYRIVETLS